MRFWSGDVYRKVFDFLEKVYLKGKLCGKVCDNSDLDVREYDL